MDCNRRTRGWRGRVGHTFYCDARLSRSGTASLRPRADSSVRPLRYPLFLACFPRGGAKFPGTAEPGGRTARGIRCGGDAFRWHGGDRWPRGSAIRLEHGHHSLRYRSARVCVILFSFRAPRRLAADCIAGIARGFRRGRAAFHRGVGDDTCPRPGAWVRGKSRRFRVASHRYRGRDDGADRSCLVVPPTGRAAVRPASL